jgi:phosphoenolpyruvate carboxykinase (ATP)
MKQKKFNLNYLGIFKPKIYRNCSVPKLYEHAIKKEENSVISDDGALIVYSGVKTGRSPLDKRIVKTPQSEKNIDWNNVNIPIDEQTFMINKVRSVDYLNTLDEIYVFDGYAGWDENHRIKVRVICSRAYHALFMNNMLIRPTKEELKNFGEPDYTIINAGQFPSNIYTQNVSSKTNISLDFEKGEIVILGTEYAGEMKKAVFSVINYIMPLKGILPMHCSANVGLDNNDVCVFFGLSGTGKTTLSADSSRKLIGDDEHCWSDDGIFNVEGGCYAKTINLDSKKEPEIFDAIKFGTVLENVTYNRKTREVHYDSKAITENTRASYPIEFVKNSQIPCIGGHPKNIIFLTCDAYGVLPPISKLSPEQASYHFISGYTSKVAGTEVGIFEPTATFSACFGGAFMPWHPNKYATLLSEKIKEHNTNVWLINTGWIGGSYGVGRRINLEYTRDMINAIHSDLFRDVQTIKEPVFGFEIPTSCPNVPEEILNPKNTWVNKEKYDQTRNKVANMFIENFKKFENNVNIDIKSAEPKIN